MNENLNRLVKNGTDFALTYENDGKLGVLKSFRSYYVPKLSKKLVDPTK